MASLDTNARVMWASPKCREIWQQKFLQISNNWIHTEFDSVVSGVRDGAWEFIPDNQLQDVCSKYGKLGLSVIPLQFLPGKVRIYCGNKPQEFLKAWNSQDNEKIGELLGFPDCCIQNFTKNWVGGDLTDPTLHMKTVDGPKEANILLRWIGIRYIPHLPCSGDCSKTAELGQAMRKIVPNPIRNYMDEILDWPVSWSTLHGAMEIFLPVCKIQGRSEITKKRIIHDRKGRIYPRYAPNGMCHPFGGEARGLPQGKDYWVEKPEFIQDGLWGNNGFSSFEAMESAHQVLVSSFQTTSNDVLCDLGAGNGYLLSKLTAKRRIGVESDLQRASMSVSGVEMLHGEIQNYQIPSDVTAVILSPIRLIEKSSPSLIEQLKRIPNVFIYAYRDTLDKYGSLAKECELAGLQGNLQILNTSQHAVAARWIP